MVSIADNLKRMRCAARLTQPELAALSGISRSTIARIEGGGVLRPSGDTLDRLARAMGRDISALYAGRRQARRAKRQVVRAA
jgi:transcriptional regulator with XRE-family HTH domain